MNQDHVTQSLSLQAGVLTPAAKPNPIAIIERVAHPKQSFIKVKLPW
jgi:hypothetical protein